LQLKYKFLFEVKKFETTLQCQLFQIYLISNFQTVFISLASKAYNISEYIYQFNLLEQKLNINIIKIDSENIDSSNDGSPNVIFPKTVSLL